MSTRNVSVHVWVGSEWGPIREKFQSFLAELWPSAPSKVAIIAESLDIDTPAGRVSSWVSQALAQAGRIAIERQPGDSFEREHAADEWVIGITELLLDPEPAQVDQLYALGIWSRFAPRRKRLLMRVTPFLTEEIVANAETVGPNLLLQIAEWRGQRLLIISTDPIAAEVISRGLRAIAQPAGDIGNTPWQSELVRIASERCLGVTSGPQITLETHVAGRVPPLIETEFHRLALAVAHLVDCPVSSVGEFMQSR